MQVDVRRWSIFSTPILRANHVVLVGSQAEDVDDSDIGYPIAHGVALCLPGNALGDAGTWISHSTVVQGLRVNHFLRRSGSHWRECPINAPP